jgi:heptosyltransferase-2
MLIQRRQPMNILLARPDGLGDEILCLPVATALRRLKPQARITFLSSEAAAPVLEHHPDLDEIVTLTGREPLGELVSLFRRGVDAVVFLKPFRRLMLAAYAARVPLRVATGYRWYSLLANRRVYEHRRDFSKHESVLNLGLLRGLGLDPGAPVPPSLVLTDSERRWAGQKLVGLPAPRAVLHPGGLSSRHWKAEHYRALARTLAGEGVGIVLTGTGAEGRRFQESLPDPDLGPRVLDLMGRLSVRQLMAVIGACQAVVSGSTGAAHVAAGLGVPTVSLFDPRRMSSPVRWQPLGMGIVLRPDVPTCEKCIYEACPYWDCLDRITVEQVAGRVRQMVHGLPQLVTVQDV